LDFRHIQKIGLSAFLTRILHPRMGGKGRGAVKKNTPPMSYIKKNIGEKMKKNEVD